SLPVNVHLLTLDQLSAKVFLLRVEHYFETDEDAVYSKSVEIDLQSVFHVLGKITDLTELTLVANLPLTNMKRLTWRTDRNESSYWKSTDSRFFQTTMVTLNPMQIKTFQVTVE
ncbi:unnamed protein product, partial [Adineta ricciae]